MVIRNLRILLFVFISTIAGINALYAADTNVATNTLTLGVPEVALLKASANIINLSLLQQTAGLSIETSKSDSSSRLLISSVMRATTRTMSAKITSGTVPTGTVLKIQAKQPNGNFVGTSGTLGSEVTLDATDRPVVTGIGTCYSNTGASDGYPLRFTYALDSNPSTYGSLRANSGIQIVVTLTLTAAQ